MTAQAAADKTRAANAVKLIEWFGGKADGQYAFQKLMFTDIGSGFGVKSLFQDPDIKAVVRQVLRHHDVREAAEARAQEGRRLAAGSANGTRSTAPPGRSAILGKTVGGRCAEEVGPGLERPARRPEPASDRRGHGRPPAVPRC